MAISGRRHRRRRCSLYNRRSPRGKGRMAGEWAQPAKPLLNEAILSRKISLC